MKHDIEIDVPEILGDKWKGKYTVAWCNLCNCATIVCPDCNNGSCSGGGCDSCVPDHAEFQKLNTHVENYCSGDIEIQMYQKFDRIKHHIVEELRRGNGTIDFKSIQARGGLSRWEETLFQRELNPPTIQ